MLRLRAVDKDHRGRPQLSRQAYLRIGSLAADEEHNGVLMLRSATSVQFVKQLGMFILAGKQGVF